MRLVVPDGELVLAAGPTRLAYDPRDILDRRLLISFLELTNPYVHLVQYEDGSWNYTITTRFGMNFVNITALDSFNETAVGADSVAPARYVLLVTDGQPTWQRFTREVERMRYRGGRRLSYTSRLHYFSEWISDNEELGLVRNVTRDLGGVPLTVATPTLEG